MTPDDLVGEVVALVLCVEIGDEAALNHLIDGYEDDEARALLAAVAAALHGYGRALHGDGFVDALRAWHPGGAP